MGIYLFMGLGMSMIILSLIGKKAQIEQLLWIPVKCLGKDFMKPEKKH